MARLQIHRAEGQWDSDGDDSITANDDAFAYHMPLPDDLLGEDGIMSHMDVFTADSNASLSVHIDMAQVAQGRLFRPSGQPYHVPRLILPRPRHWPSGYGRRLPVGHDGALTLQKHLCATGHPRVARPRWGGWWRRSPRKSVPLQP